MVEEFKLPDWKKSSIKEKFKLLYLNGRKFNCSVWMEKGFILLDLKSEKGFAAQLEWTKDLTWNEKGFKLINLNKWRKDLCLLTWNEKGFIPINLNK